MTCVLFGKFCKTRSKLQQLYVKPLNVWPSAYGKLKSHLGIKETSGVKAEASKCNMHNDAVCLLAHFVQRIQHRNSINIQLDKARAETARKNREALDQ